MANVKKPTAKAAAVKPAVAAKTETVTQENNAEPVKTEAVKAEPAKEIKPEAAAMPAASAAETKTAAEAKITSAAKVTSAAKAAKSAAKTAAGKTEAGKGAAGKTVKTAVRKTTVKKTEAPKAAPDTEVKEALKQSVHVQFDGRSYTTEDLVKIAKDVWKFDLNRKEEEMKSLDIYVKPEEKVAYYVVNGEIRGSFDI